MSGLAIAAKQAGYKVTGVDAGAYPPATDNLQTAGIHYDTGFDPTRLTKEMTIVLGNTIAKDNPELTAARKQNLPILSYPQLVEQLTVNQRRIVVAGTHGKTTTSSLITWLLQSAGQDPDYILGMTPAGATSAARLKQADKVVIEGDEYSSSALDSASKFLYYHPHVLVLTALDYDHPDLFKRYQDMVESYHHLIEDLDPKAAIIANGDDVELVALLKQFDRPFLTYGLGPENDYQAADLMLGENDTSFTVYQHGAKQETWTMQLAGKHNVANALAALIVAELEQVDTLAAANGLASFAGVPRRFEQVANINDIIMVDDYAHNPQKVAVTIQAARDTFPEHRVWAVFRAHTYSRTKAFATEFATALSAADFILLSPIEAARESSQEAVISEAEIARHIQSLQPKPVHLVDNDDARRLLSNNVQPRDVVLFMYVSGLKDVVAKVVADLEDKWQS